MRCTVLAVGAIYKWVAHHGCQYPARICTQNMTDDSTTTHHLLIGSSN